MPTKNAGPKDICAKCGTSRRAKGLSRSKPPALAPRVDSTAAKRALAACTPEVAPLPRIYGWP